jgi:ribosomal protein L16 Arg81 hydroxylase
VDLAHLLEPVTVDQFRERYWEKEPLILQRDRPDHHDEVLTLADLDHVLYHSSLRSDDVEVIRDGQVVPATRIHASGSNRSEGGLEGLYQEYRAGASVVFLFLHERWAPLKRLCQTLSQELSCRTQANVYLTPRAEQGFRTHYDAHDVLVLQTHGHKHWRLFEPQVPLPLGDQLPAENRRDGSDTPAVEVTLGPGDLLYVPRGCPHDARAVDSASLHVTIGLLPITWASVITGAVQSVIEADARFRGSLPLGFARRAELQEESVSRLKELAADVVSKVDPTAEIAKARASAMLSTQPSLAGALMDLEAVDTLALHTPVRRRSDVLVSTTHVDDRLCLEFHGKKVWLPGYTEPDVRFMVQAEAFVPGDLPGELDPESKLVLARRLLTEGLLTTVDGRNASGENWSVSRGLEPAGVGGAGGDE